MVQNRPAMRVVRLWILLLSGVLARPEPASAAPGALATSVMTPVPGTTQSFARAVARQPNGRLLVAGTAGDGAVFALVLARHFPNGALDRSFGTNGFLTVDLGGDVANGPVALVRRDDGTLLVAATVLTGSNGDFVVARLDASGAFDAAFGAGGKQVIDFGGDDRFAAMAVDGTGRIVVAGGGGSSSFAVARLTEGGALDTTFSDDGKVTTDASGAARASAARMLAIDGGGRIIAAGQVNNGTDLDIALVVYDDLGAPDETFDDDGIVVTSLGTDPHTTNDDVANGVVVLPDGRIVVAGYRHGATASFTIVLARYEATGELDEDFGDGGIVVPPIFGGEGVAGTGLLRDVDGRLVVIGHYVANQAGGFRFPLIARFEPDGALDETFAEDGYRYFGPTVDLFSVDDAYTIIRDPHGHYVVVGVAGVTPFGPKSFSLSRIAGDGPCVAGPEQGCLASTAPRRNKLTLVAPPTGEDRLLWQWRRGEETARVTFGNPVTTHDYELCVFDGSGERVVTAAAPSADASCAGGSCWKTRDQGYKYRDPARTPSGVATVQLIAGGEGEASIRLEARGASLTLPSLPVDPAITVQLHASNGVCWESVHEAADVSRNDATRFVANGTR